MTNDNKKTKNNAPCEERQETRELTEEELEQVTGGLEPHHGAIRYDVGQHIGDKLAAAGKAIGIGLSHGSVDGPAAIR